MKTGFFTSELIAPCGINCGTCYAFLRDKKKCPGCRNLTDEYNISCIRCTIRNCNLLAESGLKFCHSCKRPCQRLKGLDKRYKAKYGMSMLENLENIKKHGIRTFVKNEKTRWSCPNCGNVICVHREECTYCGSKRKMNRF
ncbi:MAG: DUF3795 domain-containing protein [Ignavibacteriaceae bacterium]